MTSPEDPERESPSEGVDLSKSGDPAGEAPFDPYRFGRPEHPIPAEYAPPGYTGPVVPTAPPPPPPGWGAPPRANPANPFSNPPGTPYSPYGEQPPGYPPPGQHPWGPPPGQHPWAPPPGYGYTQRSGTGKAVTALVLGIGSIFFCWLFFFDAALVIPGLIFALIALSEAGRPGGSGRAMALAGLICSVIGGVLATVATVLLVHAANQCGGLNNGNAPGFNQCVKDHYF